jgi:hypothetical protein
MDVPYLQMLQDYPLAYPRQKKILYLTVIVNIEFIIAVKAHLFHFKALEIDPRVKATDICHGRHAFNELRFCFLQ